MECGQDITEASLRLRYGYVPKSSKALTERLRKQTRCSSLCFKRVTANFVPMLRWLPRYRFRKCIVGDVVSGLTTAVVRIPQGLAYGLLAGLLPINGLYTGFFSPLVYAIFGTSRHISVGVFSIVSLMLGSALDRYDNDASQQAHQPVDAGSTNFTTTVAPEENQTLADMSCNEDAHGDTENFDAQNLLVMCSLSILIGMILVFLGICRMGIVAMFLSDPLVSAFTTGAAIYVVTAQLKYVTGINLKRQSGAFGLIKTYIELFSHLGDIKWASVVLSAICLVILVPAKYVNRTYKARLKNLPIPVELFIVILGTVSSGALGLHDTYCIKVVGHVPSGMPSPVLPQPSLWPQLVGDAISISVVIFAVAVSMGKIFAKKHGYTIDPNQELLALGLCQITCGFFRGHSGGGALARSTVQESSGGNTQVAGLVSCVILLLVLLVIGPLFKNLPVACLACIILANLHGLLMQFNALPELWKLDKYDFAVWVFTFMSVILLGVDLGLGAGVVFMLCCSGLRASQAKIKFLGQLPESSNYRDVELFNAAVQIPGIKIIQFSQSPTYANKGLLQQITPDLLREGNESNLATDEEGTETLSDSPQARLTQLSPAEPLKTQYLIIDCSCWSAIDTVGMSTLKAVLKDLTGVGIKVFMASVNNEIYHKLTLCGTLDQKDEGSLVQVFPSLCNAVFVAKANIQVPDVSFVDSIV